jgi:anti-sigma regulatory factor (Ser/Thr protein kinase)
MEKNFKRDFNALDEVFEWIAAFVTAQQIDPGAAYAVNLAVEELFTNMVKYGAGNTADIVISIARGGRFWRATSCNRFWSARSIAS